jgi:peptidoglycan/LPS O-acetylase OafA/YrhL
VTGPSVADNGPTAASRARRGTGTLLLLALAGAHLAPLRDWHARAGYIDAGLAAVGLAALGSATALAARGDRRDWRCAGALAASAATAYLVSRGLGWPGDARVIGRWSSPDGTAAFAADLVALAAATAIPRRPAVPRPGSARAGSR